MEKTMAFHPFPLYPAFRCGKATPWGGDALRRIYGKNTTDPHTGESLEMSVIQGLESTDQYGVPLTALIERNQRDMLGSRIEGPFPLLLKLIDAHEKLSVQVHPDDQYAARHEGKLGKTEAWVILRTEPGAQLVYGIKEGTTLEALRRACGNGKEIESLLRYVPVRPGDVFYIPSGMVHAIGAGVMLYEIQQSSDITYRFYDWDRVDAQGNRRELHIRQALDVAKLDLQPEAVKPETIPDRSCRHEKLLDTRYFSLERLYDCENAPFCAKHAHFSVLTLLTDGAIRCENETLSFPAGQTVFIPAECAPFTLTCGLCLIASRGV